MVISVFAQPTQAFNQAYDASRARSRNQLATQRANRLAQDIQDPVMRDVLGGLSGEEGLAAIGQYEQQRRAAEAASAAAAEQTQYNRSQDAAQAQREGLEKFGELMGQVGASLERASPENLPRLLESAARQANMLGEAYGISDLIETEDPQEFYQAAMLFRGQRDGNYQLRVAVNPETGMPEFVAIDPNTGGSRFTGIQSPDRESDIGAIMGALPGLMSANHSSQLIRDEYTSAREELAAANDMLDYTADIERIMAEVGPGSSGLVGMIRQSGQGMLEQLSQIPGAAGFISQSKEAAQNPEQFFEDPETAARFFDPNLAPQQYLIHSLAFAIARARDPGGRLSDSEVRNAVNSLGDGLFGSDSQRRATLDQVRREAERRAERASAALDRILGMNPSLGAAANQPDPNRRPGVRPDPSASSQGDQREPPPPDASIEDIIEFYRNVAPGNQ